MGAIFIFTFFSCEKENFAENDGSKKSKGFKILTYSSASSSENERVALNNILSFATEEDYNNTLDSLETSFNDFSLQFEEDNKNLNDVQLNANVENQNIDLEAPLTNFETVNNFNSLRKSLNDREIDWLSQPNPDFNECPQIHSITSQAERTLGMKMAKL